MRCYGTSTPEAAPSCLVRPRSALANVSRTRQPASSDCSRRSGPPTQPTIYGVSRDLGSLRSNSLGSVLPGDGQFKHLFVGVATKVWPTLWSDAASHSDEVLDVARTAGSDVIVTGPEVASEVAPVPRECMSRVLRICRSSSRTTLPFRNSRSSYLA
jgi:hypothetical protein